jgi:ATP-dependent RNA helicase DeaD
MATTSREDGFASLGVEPRLVAALSALGYEEPTPIQREAIPPLLAGADVLGLAATGTGKTAAFALPMLQRLAGEKGSGVRGLVLVPTRELAMQVAEALHRYGRGLRLTVLPVYGGQWIGQQLKALARGVDVVVATPGRATDLMARGRLDLSGVRVAVLDEADEMMDLGFADALDTILDATPADRQTALFSATMPPRIAQLAARRLRDPRRVTVAADRPSRGEVPRVRQVAYLVPRAHKPSALQRVLDVEAPSSALVFCRTRGAVDELTGQLEAHGYRVAALHGGLNQAQRDRVMGRFREGGIDLVVATDVAARGLDIPHLSHVFNYDLPTAPDQYVHRIGRTGRAGRTGTAVSFAQPREERLLRDIEKATRQKIELQRVPTVADLRARRVELTRASLREALVAGGFEDFRGVVESLAEEFDLLDVAAAAVRLAHGEGGGPGGKAAAADEEIPPARFEAREEAAAARPGKKERAPEREREAQRGDFERVFVGAGRTSGVRPGDLVGALVKGGGLDARALGAIHIGDGFAIVEVRSEDAERAIEALRDTMLRGRKVVVRRDAHGGERPVHRPRPGNKRRPTPR